MSSVNVKWRKSSFSSDGQCVEVAQVETALGVQVWVRDSKLGESSPVLRFSEREWSAFHAGMLALFGGFRDVA